jgi:hypothetical protein
VSTHTPAGPLLSDHFPDKGATLSVCREKTRPETRACLDYFESLLRFADHGSGLREDFLWHEQV